MKIRVLITAYEAAPFFKRGGLGDVIGSLPAALKGAGVDARVVIPYYEEVRKNFQEKKIGEFIVHFGEGEEQVSVYEGNFPDTDVIAYFLSNKPNLDYFKSRGRDKKIDQFAFFDLAVAKFIEWLSKNKKWLPSLIHCNDWHTALIPLILKKKLGLNIPSLLTMHNHLYQAQGSNRVLDLLHIEDEKTLEIKRGFPATEINMLGEGILHSDRISAVSPTYAEEISNHEFGDLVFNFLHTRKLDGKDGKVVGILNGIDYDVWNPEKDKFISKNYDISNWTIGKKQNKEFLLKSLSLEDRPTFCFVGRMSGQKGLDVLIKAAKRIAGFNINVVILGSGDLKIGKSVKKLAQMHPDFIRVEFVYSEQLAHQIYAGSDFILIPSHYEPCGLIQMIAMHYGTLPLASKTGGLKDSIKNNSNGFLFKKNSSHSLVKAIKKALIIYHDKPKYERMVKRAMYSDFSWQKSAKRYKRLYVDMLKNAIVAN